MKAEVILKKHLTRYMQESGSPTISDVSLGYYIAAMEEYKQQSNNVESKQIYCGYCGRKKEHKVETDINTPLICPYVFCSKPTTPNIEESTHKDAIDYDDDIF